MYLKAIEVSEVKTASTGNQFKTITFQELSEWAMLPQGQVEVKTNATPKKRTVWSNQDGLFHSMNANDVTFGTIKRLEVEEYEIVNTASGEVTKASTTSVVQFRGESDETTALRYGKKIRKSGVITEEAKVNAQVAIEAVNVGQQVPA